MKYPVICFTSNVNDKIFLIPTKQSILDLSRKNDLDLGAKIFTSLLNISYEIEKDNYIINIIDSNDLQKDLLNFEKKTLLSTNDYQCIFIFDKNPISEIEDRDIETIEDFVNINLAEKQTKKYFN